MGYGSTYVERTTEGQGMSPGEIFDLLTSAGFVSIGMWGGWDRRSLRKADGFFVARAERPISRPVGLDTSVQKNL